VVLDSYIELLQVKNTSQDCRDYFSRIEEASGQITSMIRFTGEYEKIGVGSAVWQNLPGLVTSAAAGVTFGNIAFENDLPAEVEVFADPLIVRVFFNLIDNAMRHGGRIRVIRFSCTTRGTSRVIVCEDDGDGVVPGEKELIFERGFGKNTGFGLAISREILDITGISIKETGKPGTGARFEMVVPEEAWRTTGRSWVRIKCAVPKRSALPAFTKRYRSRAGASGDRPLRPAPGSGSRSSASGTRSGTARYRHLPRARRGTG